MNDCAMNLFAIVLGIAPCLEEDLKIVEALPDCDYFAVGLDCSDRVKFNIQHACSYHPDEFPEFKRRRARIGGNLDYMTHAHRGEVDMVWPLVSAGGNGESGSSSFLATQVAVGLGYQKVILCGCPMVGPNYDPSKKTRYDTFQKGWVAFATIMFGDKVKSVSGWTKDFLGYPTEEWIHEE